MTKTLTIVRHADALHNASGESDFDRKLSTKGEKDAAAMARHLRQKGLRPDLILASPAKRAKQTAEIFAEQLEMDSEVQYELEMYNASEQTLANVIRSSAIPDETNSLMIVAHNPGISRLGMQHSALIQNFLPPCGVLVLQLELDSWSDFQPKKSRLLSTEFPEDLS